MIDSTNDYLPAVHQCGRIFFELYSGSNIYPPILFTTRVWQKYGAQKM